MARKIDYHSQEFDELKEQAETLRDPSRREEQKEFLQNLRLEYSKNDERDIIERIAKGERS